MDLGFDENQEQHITAEDFLSDRKEAKKRKREEKRLRRRYKFSDKKHSPLGIASSILALLALGLMIAAVTLSVQAHGEGGSLVGIFAVVSFFLALAGVVCGLVAFRNTDVFLRFAWIGVIANGVLWLFAAVMFVIGF